MMQISASAGVGELQLMDHELPENDDQRVITEVTRNQIQHFTNTDPPCRAVELPEGVMLRYNLAQSQYFYLRTAVLDGKITTRIFATDSPYVWEKNHIGEVKTPMFEHDADLSHLRKVEQVLRAWVDFVAENPDQDKDFTSFQFGR
jgi:hypothetical protein